MLLCKPLNVIQDTSLLIYSMCQLRVGRGFGRKTFLAFHGHNPISIQNFADCFYTYVTDFWSKTQAIFHHR